MDSFLITLVIVAIAALSNWLQHRAQARDEAPPDHKPPPPVPAPPRPRRLGPPQPGGPRPQPKPAAPEANWEEVLRRLLSGETAAQPPVQPRTPAPAPAPAPPPIGRAVPPAHPRPVVAGPPPPPVSSPPPAPALARPTGHESAYGQAQHLHESVAKRLREVHAHAEHRRPQSERRHRDSRPELADIHNIRHDPTAARRAFVASLVFGPPRGLE
jgi:hypothetical protein